MKARLAGLVGVFRTLAEQHGVVVALFDRVRAHGDKRAQLWPRIRRELISHEHGEMRELYAALRARPMTRAIADHHDQEAKQLEALIARLDDLVIESPEWGAAFNELASLVVQHASEEEKQIFPKAQQELGEDTARELDARFRATRKQIADNLE
ncbi:MAG TPA: hemerythrin domain-containing protein [Kofleriaceae bacterium]|nr:hemerythrin domain-containing protein [Kofleriaceae bacterium]